MDFAFFFVILALLVSLTGAIMIVVGHTAVAASAPRRKAEAAVPNAKLHQA